MDRTRKAKQNGSKNPEQPREKRDRKLRKVRMAVIGIPPVLAEATGRVIRTLIETGEAIDAKRTKRSPTVRLKVVGAMKKARKGLSRGLPKIRARVSRMLEEAKSESEKKTRKRRMRRTTPSRKPLPQH